MLKNILLKKNISKSRLSKYQFLPSWVDRKQNSVLYWSLGSSKTLYFLLLLLVLFCSNKLWGLNNNKINSFLWLPHKMECNNKYLYLFFRKYDEYLLHERRDLCVILYTILIPFVDFSIPWFSIWHMK